MMSLLSGCMNIGVKDVMGILVNVLLLVVVFGVTFVNLGMKQSAPVNFKESLIRSTHSMTTDFKQSIHFYLIVISLGCSVNHGRIIAFATFVYTYK